MAKKNSSKQKLSPKQMRAREQAALERQRKAEEQKQRKAMFKRVGVIVVCAILALALSLPTMGLMLLGGA